jgi:hypothetical protein
VPGQGFYPLMRMRGAWNPDGRSAGLVFTHTDLPKTGHRLRL